MHLLFTQAAASLSCDDVCTAYVNVRYIMQSVVGGSREKDKKDM